MQFARKPRRGGERSSAIPGVFNTTELLEKVLVLVDMKTLLLASRVCLKWKAVIDNSPAIQKKLFMWPIDDIKEALELGMLEPRLFTVPVTRFPPTRLGLCITSVDFVLPNPMLDYTWHHGHINLDVKSLRGSTTQRAMYKVRNAVWNMRKKPAAAPSWTRMLITQPPRYKIAVYHDNTDSISQEPRVVFFERQADPSSYWLRTKADVVIVDAWQVRRCTSPELASDALLADDE